MSSAQVWDRFEGKRKDGTVLKLRIQDLPSARLNDALDLIVNFYARDEALHRAAGIINNPISMDGYRKYQELFLSSSSCRAVICCSDDTEEVNDLMGLSLINLKKNIMLKKQDSQIPRKELDKLVEIVSEVVMTYNPVKEFNLDIYYDGKGMVVNPEYRRLGIAEHFFKVRRLMCKAHGVPMTGAWMTGFGTQIAAAKDGWETVCEIEYDYLAKKYDVTFTDVPPTMKFMLTKVGNSSNTKN